jgi:antitoxin component HigA of HigAB toxin-antitoxin module
MSSRDEPDFDRTLAAERLILEATELIELLLGIENVNRTELANRWGRSKPYVTQTLSGERNLTLRTLAEMTHVLGYRVHLTIDPIRR